MNVQIFLNNGRVVNARINNYNATELANMMNDPKIYVISIGDMIFNKGIIQLIAPSPEEVPAD